VYTGPSVAAADLIAGKKVLDMTIPEGVNERYVRLRYTVTGTTASAGAIFAGITLDQQV